MNTDLRFATTKERLEALAREAEIDPVAQIWDWTLAAFCVAVSNGRANRMDREMEERVAKATERAAGR